MGLEKKMKKLLVLALIIISFTSCGSDSSGNETKNAAPTISAFTNIEIDANTSTSAISFTIGDNETEASALQLTALSDNEALISSSEISFGGSGAERTVTLSPKADQSGSAKIGIKVSDGAKEGISSFTLSVRPVLSFAEYLSEGTSAFDTGDFATALSKFNLAKNQNSDSSSVYHWLGWANFKLDNLADAKSAFATALTKANPSEDAYAGFSFVLNAQKEYENSNTNLNILFADLDSDWVFAHGLNLGMDHLRLLYAQNYFALGDFSQSLSWVQAVDSGFSANVNTSEGVGRAHV